MEQAKKSPISPFRPGVPLWGRRLPQRPRRGRTASEGRGLDANAAPASATIACQNRKIALLSSKWQKTGPAGRDNRSQARDG